MILSQLERVQGMSLLLEGLTEVYAPAGLPDSPTTHVCPPPKKHTNKSLLLGVWPLAFLPSPILLNAELAGGLAFVYPCLYSHSLGYTLMFSSVIWRTPLLSPRLEYSV